MQALNAPVGVVGFVGRLQREGVLSDARDAEGVRDTSDCNHQGVVAQGAARMTSTPRSSTMAATAISAARPVDALQCTVAESEVVPARLREVVELVRVDIHASRGDLVQERLPDVGLVLVHESDGGAPSAPKAVPCPGRELEPSGPASDDNDAMGIGHGFSAGRETLI
jgi:hypothetical protein